MTKYDIATPYTAVYVVLRKDGKIAFVLRSNTDWMNGYYTLLAGKVEKNEAFLAAAVREAKEEAGVGINPEHLKHRLTMHRQGPDDDTVWVDMFFEAAQWQGEPHNAEPHMHSELAWLDPTNLPENVIPGVRLAIEAIEAGKTYLEYGWAS